MGFISRTILRNRYNCNKTVFLRLYERSYSTVTIKQRIPKKFGVYVTCHRDRSVTAMTEQEMVSSIVNEQIPEHKIMHSLLQNSIHYKDTIIAPVKAHMQVTSEEVSQLYDIDWSKQTAQSILNATRKLTYCHLSGSRFEITLYNNIINAAASKLSDLDDDHIKIFMQCLIMLSNMRDDRTNYKMVMNALSKECLHRFFSGGVKELLLMCDAFYQLEAADVDYFWRAMRKIATKPQKLSGKNLVHLMFLYNLTKTKSFINMFEIECKLEECLSELTGNDIGIIARGFFLQKMGIRNRTLMPLIMVKVKNSLPTMNSVSLGSVMKLIRYSNCGHCLSQFQDLLVHLQDEIPKLSLKCLTHVAHAFSGQRVYNEILTRSIYERVKKEIKGARLKDIERIIYSISSIAPFTDYYTDICHTLLNEVLQTYQTDRAAEINSFPGSLMRIQVHLGIRGIYVPELLEYTFEPTFLRKTYKNSFKHLSNESLLLHCSTKIELPSYQGPLVPKDIYNYLIKKLSYNDDIQRRDSSLRLRIEIVHILKTKLGINVCVDYILPHYFARDIVFGVDTQGNQVDVEPILSEMESGTIKSVNSDDLKHIKWKVLFILFTSAKVLGHDGYTGTVYQKYRQYKVIGYTPIPICEQKWHDYATEEEKERYLRKVIYEEVNHEL